MHLVFLLALAAATAGLAPGAGAVTPPPGLSALAQASRVVVLGERHGEPKSHALFLALVRGALAAGDRVWVGLEIPGDRQDELDEVLEGERPGTALAHPLVDSPSYRDLVWALGTVGSSARLAVRAIDAPAGDRLPRDQHMARQVADAAGDEAFDRVLVLVGNLHALRAVPWAAEAGRPGPKLAGFLADKGVASASVVQVFPPSCGEGPRPAFHPAGRPAADAAVRALWDVLHTDPAAGTGPHTAADGAVVWDCTHQPHEGAPR